MYVSFIMQGQHASQLVITSHQFFNQLFVVLFFFLWNPKDFIDFHAGMWNLVQG